MKGLVAALLLGFPVAVHAQQTQPTVVTADIGRFWTAYDAIRATGDSATQHRLLRELFLEPGSPGLGALMQRRGYTPESYLQAIRDYPRFWASVRPNTLRAEAYAEAIERGVEGLRALYPALRPARIYFTVGALMSGGTTLDSLVLIGAEIAMADSSVVTGELPAPLGDNLRRHFDTNPLHDLVSLNVHEYVHTQQGPFGSTLLAVAVQEGVAEYVSVRATERPSAIPAVAFGKANEDRVRDRFATEMFSARWNDWLYNDFANQFGMRDLGYYVGYAIAERYVRQASDEGEAVARLIELDYQDPQAVEAVVEASRYFARPLEDLRAAYEQGRPTLVGIRGFENGATDVDPTVTEVTLTFSAPMNPRFRGFDHGPEGEEHVLRITRFVGWSEDRREATVEVALRPERRHQLTLSDQFRDDAGRALRPYVVDVTTRRSR